MTTDSTKWKDPLEFNAAEWLLNKNGDVGSGQVEEQYPYLTTAFTIAYSMVTVLSLVGNSLILVVLLRRKRMRRTVTNFFLANITIANLVYTICAPLQFFVHAHHIVLPWGTACTLLPFASTLAINVNTFSMMAASVERFVAIVYPFVAKLKKRKCGFIIAAIWIVSIVVSLPWFLLVRAKPVRSKSPANVIDSYSDFRKMMLNPSHNSNHSMSNEDVAAATTSNNSNDDPYEQLKFPPDEINDLMYDHLSSMVKPSDILDLDGGSSVELCEPIDGLLVRARLYSLFLCLVQYFLPLLVLMLTYMIIAYYVYVINTASGSQHQLDSRSMRSTTSSTTTSSYSNMLGKNKKKLVKMLILIIICFNVCWMPLQLHAAIQAINPHFITSKLSLEAQKYIWMSIHFLAFSHFCHNPFINGFLNRKFKHELISFFKYGYNRLKAFILYKSCKWIMKSRRGPFESTSVEMNKNNLSSLKVRDKSMYLLDGNNDLKEIERDQEIDELFNEINPGCLLGPIGRQFMIDKQVQQNETTPIKKESLSSSDKTSSNNKKKSSSSTTSSSSAAAAAAAAASALGASAAVVVAVGVVPSDKKTKQVHHLKPEAYSHSLGQQVSSIDSINNLNNSRAKFKSPKTNDHRKRVIYSFHSKTAAVNQLSPPSIAVYSALNNSSSSCNLGGSRRTRSSTLIANEILSATPSPLLISPATECVSMLSTTPTTPSVHFNHPLFYEAPSRNTRYGGAVKLTPNHPSAYSLATSNSASSFNNMKKTSKSL